MPVGWRGPTRYRVRLSALRIAMAAATASGSPEWAFCAASQENRAGEPIDVGQVACGVGDCSIADISHLQQFDAHFPKEPSRSRADRSDAPRQTMLISASMTAIFRGGEAVLSSHQASQSPQ